MISTDLMWLKRSRQAYKIRIALRRGQSGQPAFLLILRSTFPVLLIVFLCGGTTLLKGQLGETPQKCQARYGKPVKPRDGKLQYNPPGMMLLVSFYDGVADAIYFQPIAKKTGDHSSVLSDDEITRLLRENGDKRVWRVAEQSLTEKNWCTEDGELRAHYSIPSQTLLIATREAINRETAKMQPDDHFNLKDY